MGVNISKLQNITTGVSILYAVVMTIFAVSMIMLAERDYSFTGILFYIFLASYIIGLFIGIKYPLAGAISCALLPLLIIPYFLYQFIRQGLEVFELAGSGIGLAISLIVPPILFFLTWREQVKHSNTSA